MYELCEGEPEFDPVTERLNAIFMIEETLNHQLKLGEAAITDLEDKTDLGWGATWQSRIVLLGTRGINQNGLFAEKRVGLTVYARFDNG